MSENNEKLDENQAVLVILYCTEVEPQNLKDLEKIIRKLKGKTNYLSLNQIYSVDELRGIRENLRWHNYISPNYSKGIILTGKRKKRSNVILNNIGLEKKEIKQELTNYLNPEPTA